GAIAVTRASRAIGGGCARGTRPNATGMARRGKSERNRTSDHAAVQYAAVFSHLVIGDRAVQQATVIPHHEITLPPAVGVHKSVLGGVFEQFVEESCSCGLRHASDMRGMVAEIESLASGVGMGADERVIDRRLRTRHCYRLAGARAPTEDDAQSGNALLCFIRQRRVSQ